MNSGLHLAHLETLDLSVSEYPQETVYICDFLQRVVANYGDDDDSLAKKRLQVHWKTKWQVIL